uniref:Uncharacterized protein n=1 Tax=Sphaerodactylus townsendi TaxID=933632 RepID=A0ACB8FT80_9SAUR
MALGITQILIGILEISFGLVVTMAESADSYFNSGAHYATPYWLGILYIISGSPSVVAAKRPKVPLVKGMLAMNVVSSVAAGTAIVIHFITIFHPIYYIGCQSYRHRDMPPDICHELVAIPYNIMYGVLAILLAVTVLEFLISITSAAFGCATVCRNAYSETEQSVMSKMQDVWRLMALFLLMGKSEERKHTTGCQELYDNAPKKGLDRAYRLPSLAKIIQADHEHVQDTNAHSYLDHDFPRPEQEAEFLHHVTPWASEGMKPLLESE